MGQTSSKSNNNDEPTKNGGATVMTTYNTASARAKAATNNHANAVVANNTKLTIHYFDLGSVAGRGGVQRFFLLANGLASLLDDEQLYDVTNPNSWGVEKKRLLETKENPCGSLPVLVMTTTTTHTAAGGGSRSSSNRQHFCQHISTCRYLARKFQLLPAAVHNNDTTNNNNTNHKDDEDAFWTEYVQDVVTEEYHDFRAQFAHYAFYCQNAKEKDEYKTKTVPWFLTKLNGLYEKYQMAAPYMSTSVAGCPLWGDAAVFTILYDHLQFQFLTRDDLKSYSYLEALYTAFGSIPAVAAWIQEKQQPTTAAAAN
ncbi:hypothetical protein ACA910_010010 [Epithemia clementina (nom. ined.)]